VGGLLGGVGGGEVARGGAIFGIGDGRLVARFNGGADGGARLAVAAVAVVGILGAGCLRLLALGGGNAALDGKGGAVCAGNAEGGGVAADLGRGYCCAGGAAWGVLRLLTLREWQAASCQHLGFMRVVMVVVVVGAVEGDVNGAEVPRHGGRTARYAAAALILRARRRGAKTDKGSGARGGRHGLTLAGSAGALAAERGVARLLAVGGRAVAVAMRVSMSMSMSMSAGSSAVHGRHKRADVRGAVVGGLGS
jgi:hypothetical protein